MIKGADSLSVSELLAIILGSGLKGKSVLTLADEMIAHFGGIKPMLEARFDELLSIDGIGPAKAVQLKAAFALALRTIAYEEREKRPIRSADDAYYHLRPYYYGKRHEEIYLLLRNTRGDLLSVEHVAKGNLSEVLAHPRDLFYPALSKSAASMIISHNHPSGDPMPSSSDITLTSKLRASGDILGIPIDDHLIVGDGHYTSFFTLNLLRERSNY